MSEKSGRRAWHFYIDDMIEFAERALHYTEGLDQQAFVDDGLTFDATLRNLELIGEAATRVPTEVMESYPAIPWRMIIATRNRLIHAYLGIDNDIVWSIIRDKLPDLVISLKALRRDLS